MAESNSGEDQGVARLTQALTDIEGVRLDGLKTMRAFQQARNRGLVQERARLEAKYGTDHPRVRKIVNRLAFDEAAGKELEREIERSEIQMPTPDPEGWLVHGRVLDQDGNGTQGLSVSLLSVDGAQSAALAQACTDARGYFALHCAPRSAAESAGDATESVALEVFQLLVTDASGHLVASDIRSLSPRPGGIDYWLIQIDPKACVPPKLVPESWPATVADAWVVRGRVLKADGSSAPGLTVSLYDRDLIFDDALGTVVTDGEGRFQVFYRRDSFGDLFSGRPDLYLKVLDATGKQLFTTERAVRCQAGRVEEINIRLKGD